MPDESWQRVREIFDSALRVKPEERRKFISEACGDDDALFDEVDSLLASHDSSEGFMETPAVAEIADAIGGNGKKLETGSLLGHYEIVESIGSGGMGEVYLARDQMLDRQVAVKILNEKFSRDESNLSRFIREAQTASALNHPNILVIHEIGACDDAHFIVSEFIEGNTLREIFKDKTLKLSEVLVVSIQIANALAAAHAAHLVHRDIKPENIMIRPDGFVKVLDFGLAKLVERKNKSILGLDESTLEQNQTAKGIILGTVKYMSPEQAKGERVDERTDIFSLGVVIYEMIAGTTPFASDSMSETFANLINAQPQPLSRFSSNVPAELQRIVSKMLRKNKDERFQTMKGLLTDLKDLRDNLTSEEKLERTASSNRQNPTLAFPPTTAGAKQQTANTRNDLSLQIKVRKKVAIAAAAVLLIGSVAAGYYFLIRAKAPIVFQAGEIKRLTTNGRVAAAAFSPDGKLIVYAQKESDDQQSLWMQYIGSENNLQIVAPGKIEYRGLDITPDGNTLYYTDEHRTLYQMGVLGGRTRKISERAGSLNGRSGVGISPDGKEIAFGRKTDAGEFVMIIANADGTNERTLALFEPPIILNVTTVSWSPDGKVIACPYAEAGSHGVLGIQAVDGKYAPILPAKWSQVFDLAWLPDSRSLVVAGSMGDTDQIGAQIWQVSYPGGEPQRLSKDSNSYLSLGIAADGKSLTALRMNENALIETTSDAGLSQPTRSTTGFEKLDGVVFLAWLPDGRFAFDSWASEKSSTLALEPIGAKTQQLASNIVSEAISPDGKSLIFTKPDGDAMWSMDLATGSEKLLLRGVNVWTDFTPDGKRVVFTSYGEKVRLMKVSAEGDEPTQLLEGNAICPAISPDGTTIAFTGPAAEMGIAFISIDGGKITKKFEARPEPMEYWSKMALQWTPDGKAINYVALNNGVSNIWRQPIDGGPPVQITKFESGRIFNFAYSRDGKQLALSRGTLNSDVVLIKNSN